MHKNATKCNETIGKWWINKHGASRIIDTFETYHFSNSNNYCGEKLEFEVMDWPSQYHAIVGHPAFAKFMVVPHYAYLMLKILGPKGTIMVQGSFEVSNTCDK
jgi:hypothetical protein